jgi:hypothetical protein
VGDHVFLLRLFEAASAQRGGVPERELVDTLRISGRSLAFARKVRSQLVGIVESRVWPVLCRSRSRAARCRDGGHSHGAEARSSSGADGPQCPDLSAGPVATEAEVLALQRAVAEGFASHIARRMPMHNGYRTLCASTPVVACAPHPQASSPVPRPTRPLSCSCICSPQRATSLQVKTGMLHCWRAL